MSEREPDVAVEDRGAVAVDRLGLGGELAEAMCAGAVDVAGLTLIGSRTSTTCAAVGQRARAVCSVLTSSCVSSDRSFLTLASHACGATGPATSAASPAVVERPAASAEVVGGVERAVPADAASASRLAATRSRAPSCTDGALCAWTAWRACSTSTARSGLVRVEAGITIHALSERAAAHGLALENLGDIDVQTIAGAISTGTTARAHAAQPLRAGASRCELVTAAG